MYKSHIVNISSIFVDLHSFRPLMLQLLFLNIPSLKSFPLYYENHASVSKAKPRQAKTLQSLQKSV